MERLDCLNGATHSEFHQILYAHYKKRSDPNPKLRDKLHRVVMINTMTATLDYYKDEYENYMSTHSNPPPLPPVDISSNRFSIATIDNNDSSNQSPSPTSSYYVKRAHDSDGSIKLKFTKIN